MFIQESQKIIDTFFNRYVSIYDSERTDYYEINCYDGNMGVMVSFSISDYKLIAYFTGDEFHIENENGESIFNYAEENEWDEDTINFLKYGNYGGDNNVYC